MKNDSLEVPAGTDGVVIGTDTFSRRMHLTDDQKKQPQGHAGLRGAMNQTAIDLFREMVGRSTRCRSEMIDPSTRQKVGASDIPEVICEQLENFNDKWIKGSKEPARPRSPRRAASGPASRRIEKEKQRQLAHMKRGDELPRACSRW